MLRANLTDNGPSDMFESEIADSAQIENQVVSQTIEECTTEVDLDKSGAFAQLPAKVMNFKARCRSSYSYAAGAGRKQRRSGSPTHHRPSSQAE